MQNKIKYLYEYILITLFYSCIYYTIESIWKQAFTDYRMFVLGGIMGLCIGLINNIFTYDTDFVFQAIFGSILITLCEAIFGYEWNTVQGLGLWDYKNTYIYAVDGNVSLFFSLFVWTTLSAITILLDDFIWYKIFKNGEKPYYIILKKKFSFYK